MTSSDSLSRRTMLTATAAAAVGASVLPRRDANAAPTSAPGPESAAQTPASPQPKDGATMRAAVYARPGRPVADNVEVVDDWPAPAPGPGQVVARTEASALNHLDLFLGFGGRPEQFPRLVGADGCGVVEAVGEGVDESWIGRRVIFNAAIRGEMDPRPDLAPDRSRRDGAMISVGLPGCHAAKFAVPVSNVCAVGDVDPEKAAAFGLTHLTAWRMLRTKAKLGPDDVVLLTGIGGGVALAALNIVKTMGCRTIVTSRHQWKLDRAAGLGADEGVLDEGQDWSARVRELTNGMGVTVCVDSVGQVLHEKCLRSLASEGRYVTCGATTGGQAQTNLLLIFARQIQLLGSSMGDMEEFYQVTSLFRAGEIDPVVDSVHDATKAADAFARLESGEQFGNVVIRWT